ncbi:radical SAM protein [Hydrogenophilus thiooxidans]|uniref:radical SAM protein n=1 Tax=Hydrogenophilus thiooxidans TaxID=2820326 RepID=UPI001C24CA91|nr:radical SAM protein [Hydrogenophilus thiooxidans]
MITPEDFKKIIRTKKIFIYSANLEGKGFVRRLDFLNLKVNGFIDSRKFKDSVHFGYPVIHPDDFFSNFTPNEAIIIITAKHREIRRLAQEFCIKNGWVRGETFFLSTDLCDFYPTIEVSGICNLKCITCNMGLPGANKRGGMMSAETYELVLHKLSNEIPFLNSVYLYQWGEPLLNPDLPKIVEISHNKGISVEISTNLMDIRNLEKLIKTEPDVLIVPCSGTGRNFEIARTGGKWKKFEKNLYKLKEYIEKHSPATFVRISYHIYKDNINKDFDEVKKIAEQLGFYFEPILAHVFPEKMLHHVLYGVPIPETMKIANDLLLYSIEEQLAYAQSVKDRPCFMIKCFPTIRWDTSVVHCSNLMEPTLTRSFLDIPLEEILKNRKANGFCNKCMQHGMHRFFDVAIKVVEKEGVRTIERI